MNRYYCMRFYVTYRCNSRCRYCNVWQEECFRDVKELAPEEAEELIRQCHAAGVRYIDFTGGEPTLYPHLARLVRYARRLGIKTEVTTNAILNDHGRMREIAGCVDKWNLSLDTLNPDTYRKIRGVDCFDAVMETLQETVKVRRPKIMTVVSGENSQELDGLISFAQRSGAEIYLNPVFSYAGTKQAEDTAEFSRQILARIYRPYTVVMLHFLEFYRDGACRPPCSANVRTLTFAPDGALMLPCYHAVQEVAAWSGNLKKMLSGGTFQSYAAQTKRACCRNCNVVPYFGISFNYWLDSCFLIQSYSEKLNHLKRDFLNGITGWQQEEERLHLHLRELLSIVRSLHIEREPGEEWLYRADWTGAGYETKVYREALDEAVYSGERKAQDCWQLTLVPHYDFDRIYERVYRKLYRGIKTGAYGGEAVRLLNEAAEFQLRWWKWYVGKYMNVTVKCFPDKEAGWISAYLQRIAAWGGAQGDGEIVQTAEELSSMLTS